MLAVGSMESDEKDVGDFLRCLNAERVGKINKLSELVWSSC